MKYPYSIEYIENTYPIMRLPKEIAVVSTFLFSDVQTVHGGEYSLSEIESVLRGEKPSSEVTGNACRLEIGKDVTSVTNTLVEDEDEPENTCVIETSELRELIVIWMDVLRDAVARPKRQ